MIYDLSIEEDRIRFRKRCNLLFHEKRFVEILDLSERTIGQRKYLHLLFGYYASQTGNSTEYVKQEIYKKTCNKDLFLIEEKDEQTGEVIKFLRSSESLTRDEMTLSINRFRNWSSNPDDGHTVIYLPTAEDKNALNRIQKEIKNNAWI